jgi:pimeloyl-ACP methyl ester carboxylesterase
MSRTKNKKKKNQCNGGIMEKITITNSRNQKLAALVFTSKNASYNIIICHGFRGTKLNAGKICGFAARLNEAGLNVIAADFAGSGDSEGDFADVTLSNQANDLESIIEYTWSRCNLPIILLGRSFGGSSVLAGGSNDNRVYGYIFWSTPVMLHDTFSAIITKEYEQLNSGQMITITDETGEFHLKPGFTEDFDRHNMAGYLQAIGNRPVLIIHGQADELVNPDNAAYMNSHLNNVQMFLVPNADHRFINLTKEREDLTLKWLMQNFHDRG